MTLYRPNRLCLGIYRHIYLYVCMYVYMYVAVINEKEAMNLKNKKAKKDIRKSLEGGKR